MHGDFANVLLMYMAGGAILAFAVPYFVIYMITKSWWKSALGAIVATGIAAFFIL